MQKIIEILYKILEGGYVDSYEYEEEKEALQITIRTLKRIQKEVKNNGISE